MEFSFTLETIREIATMFWKRTAESKIFAFHGEMGSGKTTFIHALCDVKKVKDAVGSPTFSLINEYAYLEDGIDKKIYHIDLYRVKNEEEALQAGIGDCLYNDHICFIEWPERAPGLLPENTLHIKMEVIDTQTRKLQIGNN